MTPREKFIQALRREPIEGHVPHFELVMFLTMEAIGRIHPCHRGSFLLFFSAHRIPHF